MLTKQCSRRLLSKIIASTQIDWYSGISPDGKRSVFESARTGYHEIVVCDRDGKNPEQLTFMESWSGGPKWSPDGKNIAFNNTREGHGDIYVINANGGSPKRLTSDISNDVVPNWSRDGHWIYFRSNKSGKDQVWKIPSQGGTAVQITKDGGSFARESFDGRWLYIDSQDKILKMPVSGGDKSIVFENSLGYGSWALVENGLYFVDRDRLNIKFLDFSTNKIKRLSLRIKPFLAGPIYRRTAAGFFTHTMSKQKQTFF